MTGVTVRSILAATDLGPGSERVVASAADLAARLGADLHLVYALELRELPKLDRPSFPDRTRQAEHLLQEQARGAAASREPASAVVLDYEPHRAVAARANDVSADLIVLGPHRGSQVRAHFLGTSADWVLRNAGIPTLVVRDRLRDPPRRIGVASDFSGPAARGLDFAFALAGAFGGADGGGPEILLFHAGWEVERTDNPGLEQEKLIPKLEREAEAAKSRAGEPPSVPLRTGVAWGVSPADTISEYAEQEEVDLLVLGTHGHGGFRRLVIGSVASGVARSAPCPVLLIPPPSA